MKYSYKQMGYNESVPNRDWEFDKKKYEELYPKFVEKYEERMKPLGKLESFVHDNSFNGVEAGHHIMYKCVVKVESGQKETLLMTPDGHIGYEFLVEFDQENPEYGIYYGCKGLIKEGDPEEEIEKILGFYEKIKNELFLVLNNTFLDIDFSNNRFQETNNANNRTFWPFWIALGEDEDIIEIAARATKLIRNVYKKYINGGNPSSKEAKKKPPKRTRTRYTEYDYNEVIKKIREKYGDEQVTYFESFIKKLEERGDIVKDDRYECCWRFTSFSNFEVHCRITVFCKEKGLVKKRKKKNGKIEENIPWEYFQPFFLSTSDEDFEHIKEEKPNKKSQHWGKANSWFEQFDK